MLKYNHDNHVIFVMLGSACNLSCRYCLQHDLIETPCNKQVIDTGIIDFIEQQAAIHQDWPTDIRFYGGEPLLYLADIKQVVNELNKRKANVKYSIISNGKLLNMDIVNYLNENNFGVAISWDGANTMSTRFYDVVKEKKEEILSINSLGFSAVTSTYNYPLDAFKAFVPLQDEYIKRHGRAFGVFFDEITDYAGDKTELTAFDFDKVRQQNEEIINIALEALNKDNDGEFDALSTMCIHALYINIGRQVDTAKAKQDKQFCLCSNGENVLNIDFNGNLYQCHNNWKKIGNIYTDDNETYSKSAALNRNICRDFYENECNKCPASAICYSGCPLIDQDKRKETGYCKLKRASFLPYIKIAKDMQEHPDKYKNVLN